MSKISYNPSLSTVTYNDLVSLTVGQAQIVTSNASTLAVRIPVSGIINGTLDVVLGGNFTLTAGFPTGGAFTSMRVDLNSQTLLSVSDFSLPFAGGTPDFTNLQVFLGGADILTGANLNDLIEGFGGADTIDGGGGLDIMNGNTGNDTLAGGDGADILRGGKDDDVLFGGAGADFLSGDRGSDTVSGGAGADIFHTFAGAGLDRVTDFSSAEGDRVFVLGNQYTVSQVGGDVRIDLGNGDQMLLVGVQQSALGSGWIVSI